MYHVSNDKRSCKSAELIWTGMEACLREKPFDKLKITDVYQKSFVSRATFYRLFDSLPDVIAYECDRIYAQLEEELRNAEFQSRQAFFLSMIQKWIEQEVLVQTLVENNMISVIYDTHMKNAGMMRDIFLQNVALSDTEADYLVSVLTNMIPAAVRVWYLHGKTETPKEIYRAVSRSINLIDKQLASRR